MYTLIANFYKKRGLIDDAIALTHSRLICLSKALGNTHLQVAEANHALANLYALVPAQTQEALASFEQAVKIY